MVPGRFVRFFSLSPMTRILKSEKNKNMIEKDNYIFEQKETKNNKIYWRCNVRICRARIVTSISYENLLEQIVVKYQHNHAASINDVIKKNE
jgi:hypothetical protein